MSLRSLAAIVALVVSTACAGSAPRYVTARAVANIDPQPLERSLFARDPGGQLTEEALQTILAAPIELDLPARVGVLPVVAAEDWRGPNPDYKRVPPGV